MVCQVECGGFGETPRDFYWIHIQGFCVPTRGLEMRVYRSRLVHRQRSHLPFSTLAEQIMNVLEDVASRHLSVRFAHENLVQVRRFLQRLDMEMVAEGFVYVACGNCDHVLPAIALRTNKKNMVFSAQRHSSRKHGRECVKGQPADLCCNDSIVARDTMLVSVSVTHTSRRGLPRVEYFEVCFGTWIHGLQRAAEIIVNNQTKDRELNHPIMSSESDQCFT
ncbi:hypothetical protein PILCRDRAFT_111730 [Piloderma croceum F 1598]|uniref:Uncharacterized protein n=1 Tax=Piloderma croceum (strain F 1598) TaxID=765440 RepID=A0A0C3GKJ8_PILCF|nr:hypothetical protein PILCRDRAFT_111730 [Piloderma croceum F 1598]